MICNKCGYIMSPFEKECPRCEKVDSTEQPKLISKALEFISPAQDTPNQMKKELKAPCITCQSSNTQNLNVISKNPGEVPQIYEIMKDSRDVNADIFSWQTALENDMCKLMPQGYQKPLQPQKSNSYSKFTLLSSIGCFGSPIIALFFWIFLGINPIHTVFFVILVFIGILASKSYLTNLDQRKFNESLNEWKVQCHKTQKLWEGAYNNALSSTYYCFNCNHVFQPISKKSVIANQVVYEEDHQRVQRENEDLLKMKKELLERIEHGTLPIRNEPLNYKNGELCHFASESSIWQNKYQGRSYGGVSPAISFRVAKGVRFRLGGNKGASFPMYEFESIDSGRFCITNQRIIFLGIVQSIEIPFTKLMACDYYKEGLILHKHGRGKSQFFQVEEPDIAAAVISRLINV